MVARPIRFTRLGTFYILFSLGVGAAAINTGNNLLYLMLGILLGFIVISGFLSDSGLWGISSQWSPAASLYAGEKAVMECRVFKGWFPGVAVTIQSSWTDLPAQSVFVPWITAKGSAAAPVQVVPKARGYLTLESCRYATRFPFGLFQKSHTQRFDECWIVFPRLRPLSLEFLQRQGKRPSRDSSSRQGLGAVPFVQRDYRLGDPLRRMDWKMSAKRRRFIVKEMEDEADEGDLFCLSSWPARLTASATEDLISFIASLAFAVFERSRPFGLAAPERLFRPEASRRQLHRILEYLALVNPRQSRGLPARVPAEWGTRATDILTLWAAAGHEN